MQRKVVLATPNTALCTRSSFLERKVSFNWFKPLAQLVTGIVLEVSHGDYSSYLMRGLGEPPGHADTAQYYYERAMLT